MAAHKKVDYERIEPAWRAGLQSPAQLAAAYEKDTGVSVSGHAIVKHFKKLDIPRDLGAKIRQKADSMVLAAMVAGKVTPETKSRDSAIVEQGATEQTLIRLQQRDDIQRSRKIAMNLLGELEMAGGTALPARVSSFKHLADSLKTLVGMEREAFGIDEVAKTVEGEVSGLLLSIGKRSAFPIAA